MIIYYIVADAVIFPKKYLKDYALPKMILTKKLFYPEEYQITKTFRLGMQLTNSEKKPE